MSLNKANRVHLTVDQKLFIKDNWATLAKKELVQQTFNDETLDGRSAEARAIEQYLVENAEQTGYKKGALKSTTPSKKTDTIVLTEGQQDMIVRLAKQKGATTVSIAREVFGDHKISNVHAESRAVKEFLESYDPQAASLASLTEAGEYRGPQSAQTICELINRSAVMNLTATNLTKQQKECVSHTRKCLSFTMFRQKMNGLTKQNYRDILEKTFVAYVWDKPDLNVEEVNQYIDLAYLNVVEQMKNREMVFLNDLIENTPEEERNGRAYDKLFERVKLKQSEISDVQTTKSKLYESLVGRRSNKKDKLLQENYSLTQWVKIWQDKKDRELLLRSAEARKKVVLEEKDRLASFEDAFVLISGVSEEDLK